MGPTRSIEDLPPALRDCAAWWLGELERALAARDYDLAGLADSELVRLGWIVTVRPGTRERA